MVALKKALFLFALVLLVGVTLGQTEQIITLCSALEREVVFLNGVQSIRGILTLPTTSTSDSKFPVVLLLHGFAGHMNDLKVAGGEEAMFEMTARILAQRKIASLRFDFRGSGESEGKWEDTTFTGQLSDTVSAINYLETVFEIDKERIGLLGLSQGGLIAACTAAEDARVKNVVLWSAVATPSYTYSALLGSAVKSAIKKDSQEFIEANLSWGGTTTLKKEFFDELFTVDPVAAIASYHGPLLVVVGLKDEIVFPQPQAGLMFLKYHTGREKLFQQDTGHIFDLFQVRENLEEVIEKTVEWLLETL